jgi:Fe-S cluster assembly protein SufD
LPSAAPPALLPALDDRRRAHLLQRSHELRSGREKPGRFWRIDLDAISYDARDAAPYAPPVLGGGSGRGAVITDIAGAMRDHADLVARAFGACVDPERSKFAALAAALCNSGAFVYVPADVAVDEPIEIAYRAGVQGLFPYTLVLTERGAQCTIVERLESESAAFVCGVTEIVTGEGANVTYAVDQQTAQDARVLFTRAAKPGKDSSVTFSVANLGAELSVDSIEVLVTQPGVDANVNGLFFPQGTQHVDLLSTIDHQMGDSRSQTLIKSAATGSGQARYLGNIRIAAHAQATQASLRDDALLLSKRAHIDSIPALEIAANDVKAYHGATVGALDEETIFYMTSRGIERSGAEKMIALGFFEPVIERFPTNAFRERLRRALEAKITA